MFHLNARSYLSNNIETMKTPKKRAYSERVLQVENGTFTPLIFSVHGGMSPECSFFCRRLGGLISEKRGESVSVISSWIRTRISALLRSALMCTRGTKHRYYKYLINDIDMESEEKEAKILCM